MSPTKMKRWKGKLQTEKQYNRRLQQAESGKRRKKKVNEPETECIVDGRRIIDLKVMSAYMRCTFCNEDLWLRNIVNEKRNGLASIFDVRCHNCLLINKVPTGNTHEGLFAKELFNVNTKSALGTLHAGLGYTTVNKYLKLLSIPNMNEATHKRYEREIGPIIEEVAKQSCAEATALERSLTIQNRESLEKLLPEEFRSGFLVCSTEEAEHPNRREKEAEDSLDSDPFDDTLRYITRLFVSYDMGWSKRGSGRQYDSVNGYAAMIGMETGLVLDFILRNRQCRKCSLGHARETHDCRLNFYGSAKAMEADAAAELAAKSEIFRSQNVQVGVLIGDDDSSSICAVRKACNHPVIKHSDKNHTSRGVTKALYNIDKKIDAGRELTSEAIKYLHRCFTYAVSQNSGNPDALAAALTNIPFHAFNHHENCGDWCNYRKDPENNTHTTILGGFQHERLFDQLKNLFDKLAANAEKFSSGASSQANESLNNVMSRKAPKALCYSLSESADYRYACAVSQKNLGEDYVQKVNDYYALSPSSHLAKHIERCARKAKLRSMKAKTPAFKARRRILRKQRSQLRNIRNHLEGDTYTSHMGLLSMPAVEAPVSTSSTELPKLASSVDHDDTARALVFFDLETSGLRLTCDILQIAMKHKSATFNEYVQPNENICSTASKVNGLTNEGHDLYLHGRIVTAKPPRIVAGELLQFLISLDKPCVLIAHNCAFDAPRLMHFIKKAGLVAEFTAVIDGFSDTLPLFRKKFPGEDCSLVKLAARNFALEPEKAHDAMFDVVMLQNVAFQHFTVDELLAHSKKYSAMLQYDENFKSLLPLAHLISNEIRKRMANAGISYAQIKQAHTKDRKTIISLLEKSENGKKQVIKTRKMLDVIIKHFDEVAQLNLW